MSVTSGDHQVAGQLMRRDGGRVGLDQADDKVAVVDGAEWITNQIDRQSLPLDEVGLDFYHLADNMHKARRAVYGEDPEDETDTPGQRVGGGGAAHGQARRLRGAAGRSWGVEGDAAGQKKRQAAEQLLDYVTRRRGDDPVPGVLEVGRQIGSGPTESMCKATPSKRGGGGGRPRMAAVAEGIVSLEAAWAGWCLGSPASDTALARQLNLHQEGAAPTDHRAARPGSG